MSDEPFLITSIGRTATKWLAARLKVDHEPLIFEGRAVSPKHLFMMTKMWEHKCSGLKEHQFGVIIRDPNAQLLSILNRGGTVPGSLEIFKANWENYLNVMDKLVEDGALVIEFEHMVHSPHYLGLVAEYFGVDELELDGFDERLNVIEGPHRSLPKWARVVRSAMGAHYTHWRLNGRTVKA